MGSHAGRIAGSLIAFLFPLRGLPFREAVFGGEVVCGIIPDAGKEIIKGTNARGIAEREATEEGIKGSLPEHAAPVSDGSHFQFQSKQVGAHHAGRKAWLRSKNRVTLLHNGIGLGKIEIPEQHDIIPGRFRENKGIRIKFKEVGYESILIGGMSARISR